MWHLFQDTYYTRVGGEERCRGLVKCTVKRFRVMNTPPWLWSEEKGIVTVNIADARSLQFERKDNWERHFPQTSYHQRIIGSA